VSGDKKKPGFDWIDDEREDEPLEESDAVDCDATAPQCEVEMTSRDAPAHDAEISLREEIFETFKPEPTVMVESPEDGMPIPANERSDLAVAHAFTVESVVCVEDASVYVELFADELETRGWSSDARGDRHPHIKKFHPVSGRNWGHAGDLKLRERYDEDGAETKRHEYKPDQVERRWGVLVAITGRAWIPVRARRERCEFYKRMDMANDDVPTPGDFGHHILFRNCGARRSVGGALMTVRDEAVYACDYRQPPDATTVEKWLDGPDRKRLASKKHLDLIQPFNLTG
jgi:hypothetical protein